MVLHSSEVAHSSSMLFIKFAHVWPFFHSMNETVIIFSDRLTVSCVLIVENFLILIHNELAAVHFHTLVVFSIPFFAPFSCRMENNKKNGNCLIIPHK